MYWVKKRRSSIELSNNISDRSEAKGTGIMSDLLLGERRELSGKSALYYIIVMQCHRPCSKIWRLGRKQPIEKTVEVQGNYPNFQI